MALMTIDAVAAATGEDVESIRHYEEIGLLPDPGGSPGSRLVYDDLALRRLEFIRHWRQHGTDLDSIRDLMKLVRDLNEPEELIRSLKRELQSEVEKQQASLDQLRERLRGTSRF